MMAHLEFELLGKFWNCCDLIGLLVDGLASQNDAVVDAPSGNAMEHVFERLLVMGPPERFAVDGNHIEPIAPEI